MSPDLQQALQKQLSRWQFFAPCPGANASVIDAGAGRWDGASGYADIDSMQPMMPEACCYIYSITKTFTAVLVLQLAEQGAVSLDAPVIDYLPELSLPAAVTVRRLLNHTAGIPSYTDLPAYMPENRASPSVPWTYEQVLEYTCGGELLFPAGEGWRYSNTGYMLLHRLIEIVTGNSFAASIARHIVAPLGLKDTYVACGVDEGRLVPGYCPYLNDQQVMQDVMRIYHPGWCLTGLIVSTTKEIASFYQALFDGRLLNPASLQQMMSWTSCGNEPHPFFPRPGYGLGLMIDPAWGFGGLYGHGGDGPGFNTWAMHLPDFHGRPLTLVIFCNASMGAHPFQLSKNLLRVLAEHR
ncbi:MAG: beta-lactamase family protein [Proteobacteria bacterium]|nr:beta-lactamase family protein [Pseudomonadota bacterium]